MSVAGNERGDTNVASLKHACFITCFLNIVFQEVDGEGPREVL